MDRIFSRMLSCTGFLRVSKPESFSKIGFLCPLQCLRQRKMSSLFEKFGGWVVGKFPCRLFVLFAASNFPAGTSLRFLQPFKGGSNAIFPLCCPPSAKIHSWLGGGEVSRICRKIFQVFRAGRMMDGGSVLSRAVLLRAVAAQRDNKPPPSVVLFRRVSARAFPAQSLCRPCWRNEGKSAICDGNFLLTRGRFRRRKWNP